MSLKAYSAFSTRSLVVAMIVGLLAAVLTLAAPGALAKGDREGGPYLRENSENRQHGIGVGGLLARGSIKQAQLKPRCYYARVRMDIGHVSTNWSDGVFFRYE